MAETWEETGAQANAGMLGTGWQEAGSSAIAADANGNTWQGMGSNAAGGWEGAGQDANAGGSYQGAGRYVYTGNGVVDINGNLIYQPGTSSGGGLGDNQWQDLARTYASGGSSAANSQYSQYMSPQSPTPISNSSGGSSGGSGGGSGGGSSTGNRPGYIAPGTNNSTGGLNLSGLLGLGSQFMNQQVPSTGAPDLGLNIPGISQTPGILSNQSQEGSSFGSLISGSGVQQTSQQPQAQNFNDAAQQALQSFTGQGKGESGSPFQGGMGRTGASAGSGSGFSGAPPTPFQALSQGQMSQPNTQMNAAAPLAGINPAILGMSGGGLGGSQQPGVMPGMSPIAQLGMSPTGAVSSSGGASEGATGNAPGQAGSAGPNGASQGLPGGVKTVAFVNPDMPGKPIELSPAPPPRSVTEFVNPDSPKPPQSAADAGRSAMQPPSAAGAPEAGRQALTATPKEGFPGVSVQRDIVEPAGDWAKKYLVDPFMQGAKQSMVNIGDSLVSPTGAVSQRDREGVQRILSKEELALAQRNKDHPYISGASKVVGELAPYIAGGGALRAAGMGLKGTSVASQLLKSSIFGGSVGAGQYAPTQVDRAINTSIGVLFGAVGAGISPLVSGSLKAIPKMLNSSTVGAGLGAISGYSATKNSDPATTIAATVGGAITGAAGLKYAAKGLTGKLASKAAAKADDVAPKADEFVPGFGQGRTQADQAAHLKSMREEFTPGGPGGFFDSADELAAARKTMGADMPTGRGYIKPSATPTAPQRGMLYNVADSALKAGAPVATQEATQALNRVPAPRPSGNVNVSQQAPMSPTKANNAAMMATLAKNDTKPMIESLPEAVKSAASMAPAVAKEILAQSPKRIQSLLDSKGGRTKFRAALVAVGGKDAGSQFDDMMAAQDRASPNASSITNPVEALQEKLNQINAKKGDSKAEIKQKVQTLQAKQQSAGKQVSTFSETTIERMARESRESRARRRASGGVMGAGIRSARQQPQNAFKSRMLQLLLSYMMKQPSVKTALAAPGEEGQMANTVMQQLRVKAAGG